MTLKRVFFLVSLITILSLHNIYLIALLVLLIWGISYKDFFKLNKKVIKSILLFNVGVSVGYLVISLIKGIEPFNYLIYINLKVFLITYFVFWFFNKVNVVQFFAFSKELSYLLIITLSQIISYKKSFEEFRLAYKARVVKRAREQEKGFIVRVFDIFFNKALKDSKERSLSLRARGFFD